MYIVLMSSKFDRELKYEHNIPIKSKAVTAHDFLNLVSCSGSAQNNQPRIYDSAVSMATSTKAPSATVGQVN